MNEHKNADTIITAHKQQMRIRFQHAYCLYCEHPCDKSIKSIEQCSVWQRYANKVATLRKERAAESDNPGIYRNKQWGGRTK